MKIYVIGGLGADESVISHLDLNVELEYVSWLVPERNESFTNYVQRLSKSIDTDQDFGLMGISFGGLIVNEMNKFLKPKINILISSVEYKKQLPQLLLKLGKVGLLNLIPTGLIKPPMVILNFMFSAQNKQLLKKIIESTDKTIIKWSLNQLISWENGIHLNNLIRIHGSHDRLIPLRGDAIKIQNGGHFMVVEDSVEISNIINDKLATLTH